MSAIVCGKRSFFEELPSPSVSKRARRSSLSPSRSASGSIAVISSSSSSSSLLLDHLISHFPDMDMKLLERALGECGDDVDLAIKRLNELRLCATNNVVTDAGHSAVSAEVTNQMEVVNDQAGASSEDPVALTNLPKDGTEWVELFVKEMASAANLDDARIRAARALESLEKSIRTRVSSEVTQNFQQENTILKEQIGVLAHENTILKRAVSIQHERQKGFDDKTQEVQHLKQLVSQYEEQLRTLEVNNYALSMHLKQAQQSSSIPGRFHPDIF